MPFKGLLFKFLSVDIVNPETQAATRVAVAANVRRIVGQ